MFHHIKYNDHKKRTNKFAAIYVCFLFFFISANAFAQKSPYALNDPRNPDCPCHNAQKQAEREYAQLNKLPEGNVNKNTDNNGMDQLINTTTSSNQSTNKTTTAVAGKNKRKKQLRWISQLKFRYFKKKKGLRKMHTDYAVCFHKW